MNVLKRYKREIIFLIIGGLTSRFFDWLIDMGLLLGVGANQVWLDFFYGQVALYEPNSFIRDFATAYVALYLAVCYFLTHKVILRDLFIKEKGLPHMLYSTLLLGTTLIVYMSGTAYVHYRKSVSHENDLFGLKMKAIAPYISEKEAISLNSLWVTMRSESDYENVTNRLNSHLKTAKLDKLFD